MNRRVRSALAILIVVVASAAMAACGGDEPKHTPVTPASDFSSPKDGIAFRAPKGAIVSEGVDEQVVVLRRGESTLTASRFTRDERLPDSEREYKRAARALEPEYARVNLEQGGQHGRSVTAATEVAEHDAVVANVSTIATNGARKTAKHVHFYENGQEIVIDMVASEPDFKRATAVLFDPVMSTLKISKPKDE